VEVVGHREGVSRDLREPQEALMTVPGVWCIGQVAVSACF